MTEVWRPVVYMIAICVSLGWFLLRRDAPPPPDMGQLPRILFPVGDSRSPALLADVDIATEDAPWVRALDYERRWR